MKLYLVRHGQTDFNAGGLAQGAIDIPLNATGEAQARELAKVIDQLDLDAYYVSPMLRARQTAGIITGGKILIVAHGALLLALHFNIVGYDDDTDFSTARFENCEMREYEIQY